MISIHDIINISKSSERTIKITNENENERVQNLLFSLGFKWEYSDQDFLTMEYDPFFIHINSPGNITYSNLQWVQDNGCTYFTVRDIAELNGSGSKVLVGHYLACSSIEISFFVDTLLRQGYTCTNRKLLSDMIFSLPVLFHVELFPNHLFTLIEVQRINVPNNDSMEFDVL